MVENGGCVGVGFSTGACRFLALRVEHWRRWLVVVKQWVEESPLIGICHVRLELM